MKKRDLHIDDSDSFWTIITYTRPNGEVFTRKYGGFRVKECLKKFKKQLRK